MTTSPLKFGQPRHYGFQFRIATLLAVTGWIALVCGALKSPNALWVAVICGLTLLSLPTAAMVAIYRIGRARAVAIGFLIFCGVYVVYYDMPRLTQAAFLAGLGNARWSWTDSPPLLLYYGLHGNPVPPSPSVSTGPFGAPVASLFVFLAIFHHALATVLGAAGAILAQVLYATQSRDAHTT